VAEHLQALQALSPIFSFLSAGTPVTATYMRQPQLTCDNRNFPAVPTFHNSNVQARLYIPATLHPHLQKVSIETLINAGTSTSVLFL